MNSRWPMFGRLVAMVLFATAMRRHADLGDTLSAGAFWVLIAIGTALLLVCAPRAQLERSTERSVGRRHAWLVAIGLTWILAVPSEPAIAVAVMGLAVVASLASVSWRIAAGWQFALLAMLVAIAMTALVDAMALMRASFAFVTTGVAWILQGLGVSAGSAGDQLVVAGPKLEQPFRATPNTLGLAAHGAVATLALLCRWVMGPHRAELRWWAPLAYLPMAMTLRLVALAGIGIALDHGTRHDDVHFDQSVFLDWRYGLVLDLVAASVAGFFCLHGRRETALDTGHVPPAPHQLPLLFAVGSVIVGLSWSSDRILDCCGAAKTGRIAIDERHSRWESSDIHITRDHYGQESGYNFRGLADWLEAGFGKIRRIYDPIDAAGLRNVDVLVIKTPTQQFTVAELDALHDYVMQGGGLVLIGDHTNVYGTSEILNEIAVPYGFRFEYDCCFDHRNRFEYCYHKESHVHNHPILRGLDSILFEVGCTLDIDSPRVRPILVGRSIKSQLIDYGVENFYGSPRDTSEQNSGQFALLATRAVGRGRVVAIADSTLFSTFSVFMPGRREIVEGMLAYANRYDVGEGLRELLQRLSVGLTVATLLFGMRRIGITALTTCSLIAWGASNLGVAAAEAWLHPGNPDFRSFNAKRDVKFILEDAPLRWAVHGFVSDIDAKFDLFFQYVTRSGGFPRLVRDLEDATSSSGPVIWIDPAPVDPNGAEQSLATFIETGGTVILLETRPNTLVGGIASRAGLQLADGDASSNLSSHFGEIRVPPTAGAFRSITGGRALLTSTADARCVAAVQTFGQGQVAVITCGALFSDAHYGFRYAAIPDPNLRRLYEVQYAIFAAGLSPVRDDSR